MVFARPLALYWLLLAIPIIVLYVRRTRPRRLPIATGMLWQRVLQSHPHGARWRPWRAALSCALHLLVLALIVVAAAEPQQVAMANHENIVVPLAVGGNRWFEAEPPVGAGGYAVVCVWLAGAAVLLLIAEWALHQRRWTC